MVSSKGLFLNYFWAFSGQLAYFIISLLGNVVLARILGPKEFGQIGVVMFFLILGKILTESGLSGALIRMKTVSEIDYSTIFLFNLFLSLAIFSLVFFIAGPISVFYNDQMLEDVLIVASTVIVISSLQFVQNAKLVRGMRFKRKSVYETVSIGIAMCIGIVLALQGYGVWSVVFVHIGFSSALTLLLWGIEGPLRTYRFSMSSFKILYKFGVNTTAASLISTGFDNIYQVIIGRYFSIFQAGLFYQAKKLQEIPIQIFNAASQGVFFSTLSKLQDDKDALASVYNRAFSLLSAIIGFVCLTIFIYSENFLVIIYGEKWVSATLMMQLMVVGSFFFMQEQFNRILFKVYDMTDKILWLEILKKTIQSLTIVLGLYLNNIQVLIAGLLVTNLISFGLNSFFAKRLIFKDHKLGEWYVSLKVTIISMLVLSISSWLFSTMDLTGYHKFLILPVSAVCYFLLIELAGIIRIREVSSLFH